MLFLTQWSMFAVSAAPGLEPPAACGNHGSRWMAISRLSRILRMRAPRFLVLSSPGSCNHHGCCMKITTIWMRDGFASVLLAGGRHGGRHGGNTCEMCARVRCLKSRKKETCLCVEGLSLLVAVVSNRVGKLPQAAELGS